MIPSVLAISALLLAPVTLWADSDKEGSAQGTACAVEACPVSLQTKASTCSAGCEQACCANAQAKLTKVQYEVKDLACAACETKVKEALASLEGVGQAAACSKEKHVTVAYDAQKVKEKQLMAAIKKAGFNVTAETVELKVDGMTCGACSGKVSKALANLKGVQQQEVCHESGKAVVTFDPNSLSREKVLAAIDQTGFKIVQ
jgi:copper ion binding protein